jgi:UDP-glucuronate 4-epimerase
MNLLVTGAAGFLGYHVACRLLSAGERVTGVDNLNAYYDPRLKRARLERLKRHSGFEFQRVDLADRAAAEALFARREFDAIVHLAAQAGVRHSLDNPHAYTESNITGFLNVLEGARRRRAGHLIYASSSSVYGSSAYGGNFKTPASTPFSIRDRCDTPISLYAATKRANELMAHCYTHLFQIPTTGLRFFTVYGPWGRPDMAPYRFARAIDLGRPIDIFNYGRMRRDFTYVDDVAESVARLIERGPRGCRLFNIGGGSPAPLMEFVHGLEAALGKRARKRFLPMQKGDVAATHADVEDLYAWTGFRPSTPLSTGIERFIAWYRDWAASVATGTTTEETTPPVSLLCSAHS